MEYIAEIKNVSKKFGDETVVREVSLSLEAGKIYGIAGRNGSGKTVLFKMIIGFLKQTAGKIFVGGKEIGKDTDFAEDIGIIIETWILGVNMTRLVPSLREPHIFLPAY